MHAFLFLFLFFLWHFFSINELLRPCFIQACFFFVAFLSICEHCDFFVVVTGKPISLMVAGHMYFCDNVTE